MVQPKQVSSAPGRRDVAVLVLGVRLLGCGGPCAGLSIKIQKKKTVTKNVYLFTDKDCDLYVTDPSIRQGGRPMTSIP